MESLTTNHVEAEQKKTDDEFIDLIKEIIDKQPPDSGINETFTLALQLAEEEQLRRAATQPPEPFKSLKQIFAEYFFGDPDRHSDKKLESEALSRIIHAQQEINDRREEAGIDPLTQVYNRRKGFQIFNDWLPDPPEFGRREHKEKQLFPFAIVLFDIDHFKQINDTFGHKTGDDVLVAVARFFQENLRTESGEDVVIRWGGEEFLMLIRASDTEIEKILENLQTQLGAMQLEPQHIRVTASIGWTMFDPANLNRDITFKRDLSVEGLAHEADQAMYVVKNRGRNGLQRWRNL